MDEFSIAVSGNGVMGQLVKEQLQAESPGSCRFQCAGCVGPGDFSSLFQIEAPIHGIIDFSHPDFLSGIAAYISVHPVPLVIATTGHNEEQLRQIHSLSQQVPVVFAANFSPGITILSRILRSISPLLSQWDVEIIEMHHNRKLDAPSGTALALADAVDPQHAMPRLTGRRGVSRRNGEIGLHAIRGGAVSGKHCVLFASANEILTFSHEAHSRSLFAQGAVLAMQFALRQTAPGLFSMEDVMFCDAK